MRRGFRVWVLGFFAAGLLTGCVLSPESNQSEPHQDASSKEENAEAVPADAMCACDASALANHFDAALQKLAVGDYEAARTSLGQHAVSGLNQAEQEASAGLDLIEAISAQNLEPDSAAASSEGARGSVLRLLLALIADLQDQIADAQAENALQAVELEKREDALKRLRELTLGQPEV